MDEDKNAAEMGLRLCYHVLGYFTLGGDKWSQYTVTVEIEPGRKWAEAKDEEPDELKPGDKVRYTGKRPIMLGLEGEFLEHIKTGKGERARVKGADNQIHYIETGDLEYIETGDLEYIETGDLEYIGQ
jgi:ASC-1-like (ASCH) protein